MGSFHPECPERLAAIEEALRSSDLIDQLTSYEAPLATREQLLRVHDESYLDSLEEASPQQGMIQLDPDTAMNPFTLEAAKRAAGAVVWATDLLVQNRASRAFCSVRPPGHHAETARAMGFCIFNSIAVGAAHALMQHGLQRVAIIDFDVHHGNGTEEIFTGSDRVLMASIFQYPLYPYSGLEPRSANMVNIALPPGSGTLELRQAVLEYWLPALEEHAPEMIFISAGFDAHREDDIANLNFIEEDYAWVTRQLVQIADRYAQGRIVSSLEGGYALAALGRSVVAHVRSLLGDTA